MRKESDFNPPWWLSNRHLQTFWAPLSPKIPLPKLHRQRVELEDGDFIDIDWLNPNRNAPTVVLLHGLEGGIDSPYLRRMLFKIHQRRWRGVLVYWRGCSGEMNRLDKTYHSGRSEDLHQVLQHVEAEINAKKGDEPRSEKIFVAGYSLGANVLLKWLGEQGDKANITAGCAVSTPFNLSICADSIDHGFSKIYKHYLLTALKRKIVTKFEPPELLKKLNLTLKDLMLIGSFREFDDRVSSRLNEFEDAEDYYRQASSINYLKTITKPALILHAQDDPFMSPDIIPTDDQLSDSLELRVSSHGGHVGFVNEASIGSASFFLEKTILNYFDRFI
ncbi:MAG: hydrolase [Kangiella sp.]|jgi:predicted alpha/beta-fold hydrolase|nr:hydrolase [Kangiella sp.]MCW9027381.1 hydrolase [Kangiella sp.]